MFEVKHSHRMKAFTSSCLHGNLNYVTNSYCCISVTGLLLANQTLKLDLACRAEKKTMLTCNDATINGLENALIAHLNDDINNRVPDKDCTFSLAGSTTCEEESIEFYIVLTCLGSRADGNLLEHVEQQQMAITRIMDRKTSEPFSSGTSTAICRLFRDSDRRKTPSAICSEDCTKEYQGAVALCDCPCKFNYMCTVSYCCTVGYTIQW